MVSDVLTSTHLFGGLEPVDLDLFGGLTLTYMFDGLG